MKVITLESVISKKEKLYFREREMEFMRCDKKHLPMCGVGPVYGAVIIAVTAAAVIAGHSALFENCTGTLLISGNLFFYPLFFFYWIFMSVLMKCTEEKWLKKLYGREYEEYCSRVNRCIPWSGGIRKG